MKKSKTNCDLNTCFMCKLCAKEWRPAIDAHRTTFLAKKGEAIFREGEEVKGIYFIFDGLVKVHKKWGDDKELILRIAHTGAILGHRGLGGNGIYPVTGTALEPSMVCYIDLDFFNSTLKVNPEFTHQMMLFFAAELQESERHMRDLAHMSVKGRVSRALIELSAKFGLTEDGFINMTLSRQDLSSLTAATYETVFRILNELAEDKCILIVEKNIKIIDQQKMLQYA